MVLFGQWEEIDDATIRCPHCGSSLISRKENKPRTKKYRDPETREWRQVEGYRYYCLNPSCPFKTFTDYAEREDLRLYSEWTVDTMLQGVMVYMHLRTTYRRAADLVGVSHVTLWRWTMIVGEQTLPVAAIFGLGAFPAAWSAWMKSGYWCRKTTNPRGNAAAGCTSTWPWTSLPTICCTSTIYPHNGKDEARAFLQALKAKGYQPRVIVT